MASGYNSRDEWPDKIERQRRSAHEAELYGRCYVLVIEDLGGALGNVRAAALAEPRSALHQVLN
jgi:hypothetical protein